MRSFRDRFYKPLLLLFAAASLFSVAPVQNRLNLRRETLGLTRIDPLENAPPMLAFTTVALGGFRGLIANMLWIRVADLQEADKFFEMVQLSDWITKLQPHFSTVWVHLAWNMSYNISVKFNDPKDRWLWVKRGIELLRDEGLRYNPREPLIYRELAWHFQHKMGANLDDAHNYYKAVWVEEMTKVLGTSRPNYDELLNPKTEEQETRVQILREKYKMEPRWMKEVDDRYGPLEWRLPETHAIYWAVVGIENTKNDTLKEQDLINLRRVIFQSMQLAFVRGRVVPMVRGAEEFTTAPNLEIVERTNRTYEEMIEYEPDMRQNIETAHRNFLKTAVYFLYEHSRLTQAEEWLKYLKKKYPTAVPPDQNLDSFALARFQEDIGETSHDKVKSAILGLFQYSLLYLAMDEDERAVGYERLAKKIWERYEKEVGPVSKARVGLPPLADLKREVLTHMLDPESGFDPRIANQLRTKFNLPAPSPASPSTNSPPSTLTPTNPSSAGLSKKD
ncbi:MAG: hypothetical protein HY735_35415 [Verrucomicrobia bacterium]|nr:hypothetical protein [Verrucomicrobiota bacterium]